MRRIKTSPVEIDIQYYLLNNASWWVAGAHPEFNRPNIQLDPVGHHEHGGQAQLQSHGLVLLLI